MGKILEVLEKESEYLSRFSDGPDDSTSRKSGMMGGPGHTNRQPQRRTVGVGGKHHLFPLLEDIFKQLVNEGECEQMRINLPNKINLKVTCVVQSLPI